MCGLAGAIQLNIRDDKWRDNLKKMASAIRHRGPDDEGVWFDSQAGIGLAHTRLSIIDLSVHGHQPMNSVSDRFIIAFNGEVYNFSSIKEELRGSGIEWRGHSDTEVILAAIEAWGLVVALKKFVGMFAIALWDRKEKVLSLVRDRLGIKPLYYGWVDGALLFGSELKALKAHPDFGPAIDRNSLALFLRHNYIPAPYSIYKGIYKLKPGHILNINQGKHLSQDSVNSICYWDARSIAESGQANLFEGSEEEASLELEKIIMESIGLRMIADVPLGAFLSGGVDSSTVVALMQAQSNRPVKTFTIGFSEQDYNEAEHAKAVAKHLGTDHTELYVTPNEALSVIPRLPYIFDEPFSDSSQIPTLLVSELTRKHVTVSLSGDGGDELFSGYGRYAATQRIWTKIGWMPGWFAHAIATLLTHTPSWMLDVIPRHVIQKISGYGRAGSASDKLKKLAELLEAHQLVNLYRAMISHWKNPQKIVIGGIEPPTVFTSNNSMANLSDAVSRMMLLDTISYLPDDILTKVDRASMSIGLEARVPLLDHRVVEFAWKLPLSMKVGGGVEKRVLKNVLYRHVPKKLLDRPKMGFGVPINLWLRGPLKDWAENLLDESSLKEQGYFEPGPIRQKWKEHLSGNHDWHYYLWDVLMFQAWLAEQ